MTGSRLTEPLDVLYYVGEVMMEMIYFTIPFGDTSDPQKVAARLAKNLQFCSWRVKVSKPAAVSDGVATTRFILMGWTTEW